MEIYDRSTVRAYPRFLAEAISGPGGTVPHGARAGELGDSPWSRSLTDIASHVPANTNTHTCTCNKLEDYG